MSRFEKVSLKQWRAGVCKALKLGEYETVDKDVQLENEQLKFVEALVFKSGNVCNA